MTSIVSYSENSFDLGSQLLIKNASIEQAAKKDDFQDLLQPDQSLKKLSSASKPSPLISETISKSSSEILEKDVEKEEIDSLSFLQISVAVQTENLNPKKNLIKFDEVTQSNPIGNHDELKLDCDEQASSLQSTNAIKENFNLSENFGQVELLEVNSEIFQEMEKPLDLKIPQKFIKELPEYVPHSSSIDEKNYAHFSFVTDQKKAHIPLVEPNLSISLIMAKNEQNEDSNYEEDMSQSEEQNNVKIPLVSEESQQSVLQNPQDDRSKSESKDFTKINNSYQDFDDNDQINKEFPLINLISDDLIPLSADFISVKTSSDFSPMFLSKMMPMQQVQVQIKQAIDKGTKEIIFDLHPLELGQVQVSLKINAQQQVEAMIKTETKEAYDILQKDTATQDIILKSFEEAGWKSDGQSLQFSYQEAPSDQQPQIFYSSADSLKHPQEEDTKSQEAQAQNFINPDRMYDILV